MDDRRAAAASPRCCQARFNTLSPPHVATPLFDTKGSTAKRLSRKLAKVGTCENGPHCTRDPDPKGVRVQIPFLVAVDNRGPTTRNPHSGRCRHAAAFAVDLAPTIPRLLRGWTGNVE